MSKEQAVKLRQYLDHINELNQHISEVEQELLRLSDKYEAALHHIPSASSLPSNRISSVPYVSHQKPHIKDAENDHIYDTK